MSNRLTFSLASLILIFAFGVIAMPAMAAPPTFDSTPPATITLTVGDTLDERLPSATDPDNGGAISYTLVPKDTSGDADDDPALSEIGLTFTVGTRILETSGTDVATLPATSRTGVTGTYVYTATTTNTAAETTAGTDAETVTHEIAITVNSSVSFGGATISNMVYKVGQAVDMQLPTATDSRTGATLAYTLEPDVSAIELAYTPVARHLGGTAALSATVEENDREYTYTATGTVGAVTATAELKFKITVVEPTPPTFDVATIPNITGKVGEAITVTQLPTATDADGDTVTHTLSANLPIGLVRNDNYVAVAGADPITVIQGTPTAAMAETEYTWTATSGGETTSLTFNITIAAADPTAPGAPTAVMAEADQTANTITISWTAPDDGGSAITGYTVTKSYMMNGTAATKEIDAGTATSVTIPPATEPALPQGVEFTFTVTATNAIGTSDASAPSAAVMINVDQVDPAIAQPTNVMAAPQNDGSIMVTWAWAGADTAETNALAGFTVMWNGQSAPVEKTMMRHTIPATMLTAGQSTMVSVMARATAGSGYTTPAAGTSAPSAVTPVSVSALRFAPGTTIADMTFTAGEAIGTTAMPYVQLPSAYGGTGVYTYSLLKGIGKVDVTDTGDNGLMVDKVNLRLVGTPTAEATSTLYTWRVTDAQAHGDIEDAVELEFNITVNAAPIITPTNTAPVVAITTTAPTTAQTGSFAIAYTVTDDNVGGMPTVEATHTLSPTTVTGYTVTAATNMVTITQAAGSPIAVVTVTITATDAGGLTHSQSISVTFAASAPTPVDTTPPTVQVMAPVAPDADGNLVFTFVFSEPIQASSFTATDITGEDYVVTAGPTMDATDTTMTTWTATVKPTGDDDVTIVVNVGAVTDMAGNANVAGAFAKYTPPTAPAAPAGLTATPAVGSVTFTWTVVAGSTYEYNTDGTTWMDATAGSVTVSGSTAITFNVRVKAAGGVPAGATATVTATPTAPAGPAPISLTAKGYLVIVGAGFNTRTLPGVTPTEVAGFPSDLAAFLIAGGTIDVAATGGDVIINEFMVARDAIKIGNGDPTDGQWIELYNKHATETATGITVSFSSARPAPAHPANFQDRLSNVVSQGWNFQGTFGAEVITGSSNREARVNFISIRRKNHGDGWNKDHWEKTPETLVFAEGRIGTPGKVNAPTVFTPVPNDRPAKSVIISEVANRMDDSKEWIELKGPAGTNLKNWKLSIATAVGTETNIFTFPNNDNIKISANGHLLLTDVDPLNGELAADYANGVPTPDRYKNAVVTLGALPNDGNFVLILRSNKDKTNHEAIQDIAGYVGAALQRANPYATLWPLRGDAGVISSHNKLVGGKVYRRAIENVEGYSATADNKLHESAFAAVGFTGLGYDRNAAVTAENGGTPGYPHGAYKHNGADAPGNVYISEIMYASSSSGPARNRSLPQWIEIHNRSDDTSVNLGDWRLEITNSAFGGYDDDGKEITYGKLTEHIGLSGTLPPNQTYLIVARKLGVSQHTRLPNERIRNVGKKIGEQLLNPNGFYLVLRANVDRPAGEHVPVDTVGNLAVEPKTARADSRSYTDHDWELADLGSVVSENGSRISLVRQHKKGTTPIAGTDSAAWILSSEARGYSGLIQLTWFGRNDDHATPGYTIGGALPVSLSKFRPERLATGEVVVRWVTESETNNAGFNILRSDAKDGEFTKLNTKLIAGQGTTSERTAYEFTDTSAKPNVFYYYQIQDVSFDGEVATLRTTHLRGNVTPAGKITTTWGELKALQ